MNFPESTLEDSTSGSPDATPSTTEPPDNPKGSNGHGEETGSVSTNPEAATTATFFSIQPLVTETVKEEEQEENSGSDSVKSSDQKRSLEIKVLEEFQDRKFIKPKGPIPRKVSIERSDTTNRIMECKEGHALVTYALIGNNRTMRDMAKEFQGDDSYHRPFKAGGIVFPPVLKVQPNGKINKYLPIASTPIDMPFTAYQRSKDISAATPGLFITAEKLLIVFKEDPGGDVYYVTPGKLFPDGTVAIRVSSDFKSKKNFYDLTDAETTDERLFQVWKDLQKGWKTGGYDVKVEFDCLPTWIFKNDYKSILEEMKLGDLPSSIFEGLSLEEAANDLRRQVNHLVEVLDEEEGRFNEDWSLVSLQKDLSKMSDKEVIGVILELWEKDKSLFSTNYDDLPDPCTTVDISDCADITDEAYGNICDQILEGNNRCKEEPDGILWDDQIVSQHAKMKIHPMVEIDKQFMQGYYARDIIPKACSPKLATLCSIGNSLCLGNRARCVMVYGDGRVSTAQSSALPLDLSQLGGSIQGSNPGSLRWLESIGSSVKEIFLFYFPYDEDDKTARRVCNSINHMILFELIFSNLRFDQVLYVKNTVRQKPVDDVTILPTLQRDPKVSLYEHGNTSTLPTNKDFIKHPLNIFEHLPENVSDFMSQDNERVWIGNAEAIPFSTESNLNLIIEGKNREYGTFPLPENLQDLTVDPTLSPKDNYEKIISKGQKGIPRKGQTASTAETATFSVGRLVSSKNPPKKILTKNKSSPKTGDLVFSGLWGTIPQAHRHAFETDLRKAVYLAYNVAPSCHNTSLTSLQGIPVYLLDQARAGNTRDKGRNAKKVHNYSSFFPSVRKQKIPGMTIETFLTKHPD